MREFILDLLLPKTDRAVGVQFAAMAVVWAIVLPWSFRWRNEYRTFVVGLALLNVAWFGARAIH